MGWLFAWSPDLQESRFDAVVNDTGCSQGLSSSYPRTGSWSYHFYSDGGSSGQAYATKNIAGSNSTLYIRFGLYMTRNGTAIVPLLRLLEDATAHLFFEVSVAGAIIVRVDNVAGAILAQSTDGVVSTGQEMCVEVYVVINDTTGTVQVKVDGTVVVNAAGTLFDTNNGGASGIVNNLHIGSVLDGGDLCNIYIDDLAIRDDAWCGQGGLYVLVPDADGTNAGWTPSAGSPWQCVDELPPDFTDYVYTSASVANVKSDFSTGSLSITPSSISVVVSLAKAKLDVAGSGSMRTYILSGSSYGSGSPATLDVGEKWVEAFLTTDPDTSATWTLIAIQAMQAGVETL